MLNVSLLKVVDGNPFLEFTQLQNIWPEPYLSIAMEAIIEDLRDQNIRDIGEIFLIVRNQNIIGISGYFPWVDENTDGKTVQPNAIGLRWHGLIEEFRGSNLSKDVIKLVLESALHKYPQVTTLIELVPLTQYGHKLIPHFEKLGFGPVGTEDRYSWAENSWQQFHLDIQKFLHRN